MKIQSPWMGRIRGSAGNMTGCKVYDKNVMRAKAFEVANPNTSAQQTQRAFFASLTALCTDFSDEQLRTLFPQKPKTMSRRNAITKQIAENYDIDGTTKSIDFSTIDTLGNAPVMDFGTTSCAFSNGSIAVVLDNSVKGNQQLAGYDFVAAIVNETQGEIYLGTDNGEVSDGSILITPPANWETTDTIHAIPLILNSNDGKVAMVGFGTISVIKRPARQK